MLTVEVQHMARQGEGTATDRAGSGGVDPGALHAAARHPRHPDDPWYQPESGVPRDEDVVEHPPLSEDD